MAEQADAVRAAGCAEIEHAGVVADEELRIDSAMCFKPTQGLQLIDFLQDSLQANLGDPLAGQAGIGVDRMDAG